MTVVDFIDFDDEEYCVKVDEVVDLSSDEVSVEEDGNVSQAKKIAEAAASLSISEHYATATKYLSKLEQEQGATTSLSMIEHGPPTSSLKAEEAKQPEFQEILVASDDAEEAIQFGNRELITVANCVGEAMQNIVEASDFELCQEVSQDTIIVAPSAHDKEKQVNTSAAECNKQLSIVHTKEVQPIVLHDSGFSVMGNAGNGEVVMCKYQGCNKPSQGKTMHCEVHSGGSKSCMVQGCTKGAHGDTSRCISHHSRLHKECCVVTGCTSARSTRTEGRTDLCVKHGGGKRCKYDGCGKGAQGKTDFCIAHGGGRQCKCEGCGKSAQGKTDFCIAHGGGRRCKFEGCGKSAQWKNDYCAEHGADRHYMMRCKYEHGCGKIARGKTGFCIEHGGGSRCKFERFRKVRQGINDYGTKHGRERCRKMCKHEHGCGKYARGKTDFCVAHGGGRRCKFEGCGKSVPWRSDYCIEHGGGRCKFLGCRVSTTCRTDFCSMHTMAILRCNNSAHEMLPTPLQKCQAEKEEPCKRRNPCSVIGVGAQKRKNTSCYVDNTTSLNVAEMGEERGRVSVCQDNVLKAKRWGCTSRRSSKDQK